MSATLCYQEVAIARKRIAAVVRHTPLLENTLLNQRLGFRLLIKPECLQHTASFKWRGVSHVLSRLDLRQYNAGLLAFSSGNHAQAVARAAHHAGVPAIIVMPASAPKIKRNHTRAYGAEVIEYDPVREDREQIAADLQQQHPHKLLIKPFDDPQIILGQATAMAEALEDAAAQHTRLDHVFIPCSGGGLLAGSCLAVEAAQQVNTALETIKITACEPKGFAAVPAALQAGQAKRLFTQLPNNSRLCDALLSPTIGQHCYAPIARSVSACASVNDTEVYTAMALVWEYLKLVVEPGGAAGLAAAMQTGRIKKNQTALVILSGGNVDHDNLPTKDLHRGANVL